MAKKSRLASKHKSLPKAPTGIAGIDEITGGGLPRGRPTLICGGAGCGKTLLAMEFLVRGATQFHEPGVFMVFEETEQDLKSNFASLGFDLDRLVAQKKIILDYVRVERSEIEATGEYDLEGLFVRLGHAIDSIGAKRVVIDTVEALFGGLPDEGILRAELRRLFAWLKQKGVTAIITGERGEGTLTRYGLEEYVADCVILLDHRLTNDVSTRRLRIVKYRGSLHGTNDYPFLIEGTGISVLPITSLGLDYAAPTQRVPSGIPRLDAMLGGKGYFRASSILISGTAGTGKTSLAAAFVEAAAHRRERSLFFAFEESSSQIVRNMSSIGIDLEPWVKKGLIHFHAARPSTYGIEMHLVSIHKIVNQVKPRIVVLDPLPNLGSQAVPQEIKSMLMRLIDFFKTEQITTLFTSLTGGGDAAEQTKIGISSLMDTWLLLRNLEHTGERNRALYVLKSRGMAHSNQIREFRLSRKGIELVDVYVGAGTVLTGAARLSQEAHEQAQSVQRAEELLRLRRQIDRKRRAAEAQMALLRETSDAEIEELQKTLEQDAAHARVREQDRRAMIRKRMADIGPPASEPSSRG
jgi:circadian clock protein KaiC